MMSSPVFSPQSISRQDFTPLPENLPPKEKMAPQEFYKEWDETKTISYLDRIEAVHPQSDSSTLRDKAEAK